MYLLDGRIAVAWGRWLVTCSALVSFAVVVPVAFVGSFGGVVDGEESVDVGPVEPWSWSSESFFVFVKDESEWVFELIGCRNY